MLARAIAAVSGSSAKPTLSVSFTVKDPDAVSAEVLRLAAASARRSAETLCAAAGVALGELVSIEYGDGELNPISRTGCGARDISAVAMMKCAESVPDITPDDISVSDTAVFVWEIRG